MAYCKKCGAYMPDEAEKCFACGYDETAEAVKPPKANAAAQTQPHTESDTTYHFRNDDEKYREQLEENRRRQQEQNRKWAEQEYARRKAAEEQSTRSTQRTAAPAPDAAQSMDSARLWSILSYVSVLCLVPYLTNKGGEEADFHARQGLRLLVFSAVADALGKVFLIGWLLQAARIFLMLTGIFNAVTGKRSPLPIIGTIGPH